VIDLNRASYSLSEKQQVNKVASKVSGVIATDGSRGLIGVVKDFYFHIIISYKEDTNERI